LIKKTKPITLIRFLPIAKTGRFILWLWFFQEKTTLGKAQFADVVGNFHFVIDDFRDLYYFYQLYDETEKIAEIKTDFINNMSHEFKTPLATISVATDSLANDKIATDPDKVKYYSGLIKQENLRMKKQVETVLNMSKLERNEMPLHLKKPT
jgi:signal transduction histidine kinase